MDYEILDLSESLNATYEALGDVDPIAQGVHDFHGIPFLMANRVISLNHSKQSINVTVERKARTVIFAHSLGTAELTDVEPVGQTVAEYVFVMGNGKNITVPIRGRFEIASLPGADFTSKRGSSGAPGLPFLAVPDQKNSLIGAGSSNAGPIKNIGSDGQTPSLMSRYSGPWHETGRRQTESVLGQAAWNYLWCWKNPSPDTVIKSVDIIPRGNNFFICALTLGHLNEHPFARKARVPVRIELIDSTKANKDFDLEVSVNRGVSTYPQPLSNKGVQEFIEDPLKGWGERINKLSSPSYTEISATPSATVRVHQNGEEIGKANFGELEKNGMVETSTIRLTSLDQGKNWVNVRVLDDDTGQPVPARVHFRSPEGVPYQPHGHHPHLNSNLDTWHIDIGGDVRLGQITYAVTDGTCQGWLPRGNVIVDIARGFEYEPLRTMIQIEPGQQKLDLRIKRWTNMNSLGWFSGDSHVHFLSTQGSHTESQAEDLNVVNLLQAQWGSLFTNKEDFTGKPSVSRQGDNIVYVSQENRQHFMGHMILWGLKQPVMPWASDGPSEAELGGPLETTLSHWADQAHSQGAYVISPHFPMPNGEPAALIATGRLDGVEMLRQTSINHNHYYQYLNCGYRLPLVGGTDKMDGAVPVGSYRTYVNIPKDEGFNYDNWCKNVARGRTFLSGGPILHFTVDGHEIGDTVPISSPGTVEVQAWAESIFPIHRLEIVKDGTVVASAESRTGTRRLEINEKIKIDGHAWLAARCGGPNYYNGFQHHDIWTRGIFAHSSPIYIACGEDWWMFNEAVAKYMLTMIEGDLAYIQETSGQSDHTNVTHHHYEENHMSYLERPFIEARKLIEERIQKSH